MAGVVPKLAMPGAGRVNWVIPLIDISFEVRSSSASAADELKSMIQVRHTHFAFIGMDTFLLVKSWASWDGLRGWLFTNERRSFQRTVV